MKQYARGAYNKFNDKEQWIRLSEGCPNNCEFCRETKECGKEPVFFEIPKIVRNKVKILDMNFIYKPNALEVIKYLGTIKFNKKVVYYEFCCGIDFRYLTLEIANALKKARFINIRFAWDYDMSYQYKMKDTLKILLKAGYKPQNIMVFMICNWKISYAECCDKLDLLKVWNLQVDDCWFDNQKSPNVKPIYWTHKQIKEFERKCRKHNLYVMFGIDPELKKKYVDDKQRKLI